MLQNRRTQNRMILMPTLPFAGRLQDPIDIKIMLLCQLCLDAAGFLNHRIDRPRFAYLCHLDQSPRSSSGVARTGIS